MVSSQPSTTRLLSLRSELDHLLTMALEEVLTAVVPLPLRPTIRARLVSQAWAPAPFRNGRLSAVDDGALLSLLESLVDEIDRLIVLYAADVDPAPDPRAALEQLRAAARG